MIAIETRYIGPSNEVIAYVGARLPDKPHRRALTDWHGNVIGECELTHAWRIKSYLSSHMYQIHATIDDRRYTGRGMGKGMVCRLRPCKY